MSEITSFPINTVVFNDLEVITDAQATDADGVLFFDESVGVMKRMTRGELFKGKVIPINSIADFSAIDVDVLSNRQQFHLNSFAPTGSSGGGPLLWAPDKPKSLHDGVRYFSPTVPIPADFDNPADVQNYMDGVGEEFPTADGIFELTLYSIQSSEFPAIDGAFVLWDGVSGNQVKNGVVPSTIGVNALQIPNITEVSYSRYNADETISMRTLVEHKTDLSLNNVDNTSDANKPISTATQAALDLKANSSDVTAALALKAPLASPVLTGNPTAPTPTTGDNDTSIATTAFVQAELVDRVQSVATIADLRNLTGLTNGQVISLVAHTSNNIGGGDFDVIGDGAIDDNGVFVSTTDGKQLKRRLQGVITPMMFGGTCSGSSDDSAAFEDMLAYIDGGGINQVLIPSDRIARVNNLSVNSHMRVFGGGKIKRLDDCDIPAVGSLAVSPGVYVFDVVNPEAWVVFDDVELDANQAAQTNLEPTGIFVRVGNMTTTNPDIRTAVIFNSVKYKNNCKLAIYTATGDDSAHRVCVAVMGKSSFINGRFNTVDYDSDFIRVTDRTDLWVENGTFEINESTSVGEYTFPAVRMTMSASTFGVDDGPRCWISDSYFKNLGRPSAAVDAIGVIDFYRQAREVHVTNNTFEDCNKSPVRGKTSAQRVTVSQNHMINCLDDYAVNITPASDSTPPNLGQYIISDNIMETCAGMISVVANTTFTDPAFDVQITGNIGRNISGLNYAIYARRIDGILLDGNTVNGSTTGGVQLRECSKQRIGKQKVYNVAGGTADHGIWIRSSYGDIDISDSEVLSATGNGITATIDGSHSGKYSVTGSTTKDTNDYGIIANTGTFTTIRYANNDCFDIAGLDRAFYAPATRTALLVIGNSTDAATPLTNAGGGVKSEVGNSWQMV